MTEARGAPAVVIASGFTQAAMTVFIVTEVRSLSGYAVAIGNVPTAERHHGLPM